MTLTRSWRCHQGTTPSAVGRSGTGRFEDLFQGREVVVERRRLGVPGFRERAPLEISPAHGYRRVRREDT
jgi:hypothetical protein